MKRLSTFIIAAVAICFSFPIRGADEKKMTVVDYFLRLPDKTFEGDAEGWLKFLKQPKCGVADLANGYLSCTGDGAQPPFEVALFRYRDGRPLLALCEGELEGEKSLILTFFVMSADGGMHQTPRSIFPLGDALVETKGGEIRYENWKFELPRHGRTILVRNQKTGKVQRKFTWNGEKFVEEKS